MAKHNRPHRYIVYTDGYGRNPRFDIGISDLTKRGR